MIKALKMSNQATVDTSALVGSRVTDITYATPEAYHEVMRRAK